MKEIYVSPELELTAYETEDVITTSGKDNDVSNNEFNKNSGVGTAWINY